jgi:hypothetical protein
MNVAAGTAGLLAVAGAALVLGARQQRRLFAADTARLRGSGVAPSGESNWRALLDTVPAPVARYLRWAVRSDVMLEEVHFRQRGELRTDPHGDRWMPFEADQVVAPRANGFVWNARVAIAPLLHVRVEDSLIGGHGAGRVTLLSAIPVGGDAATPEMDAGSLHRYLAEAVWYPTALLPSERLQWTPIDDSSARATLTDRRTTVSLDFRFGESGEVTGIYTSGRWGKFAEGYRQAPWQGRFRGYSERQGLMVPAEADVAWFLDGQWRCVWIGRITAYTSNRPGAESPRNIPRPAWNNPR